MTLARCDADNAFWSSKVCRVLRFGILLCYSIFLGPGQREDGAEDSAGLRPMRLDRGGQSGFNDEHAKRAPASEVVSYVH